MATHDYVIANGTGAAVRSDLNDALAAIVSNNSSSTEPATTYAYQWWADTTANVLKIRNSANNAWITLRELDGTMLIEDGSASTPGLAFADDVNTGIFSPAADQIGFATGGVERLEIGSSEVVFNDPSNDVDFRVESNGQTHMLFVDAGNDRVGIGTATVDELLHIESSDTTIRLKVESTGSNSYPGVRLTNDARTYDLQIDGATDAFRVYDATATSERLRIDTSGRLLVATSSALTATNAQYSNFIVRGASSGSSFDGRMALSRGTAASSLSSGSGVGSIYFTDNDSNEFAAITAAVDGTTGASDAPGRLVFSTTADGASSSTERLRIDSSGNLGVGDSSPDAKCVVYRATQFAINPAFSVKTDNGSTKSTKFEVDGDGRVYIHKPGSANQANLIITSGGAGDPGSQDPRLQFSASGFESQGTTEIRSTGSYNARALAFYTGTDTNGSERMRITAGGQCLFNTNTTFASGVQNIQTAAGDLDVGVRIKVHQAGVWGVAFQNSSNTNVGKIVVNASSVQYATTSDHRLKENVVAIADGIDRVKQLQPKRFNFIDDADITVDGFLAHEAQTVVPEAITGTHNEVDDDNNPVYQGIDQSKLVPLLTAALQEAIAKIETLETKVAALEAG